MMISQQEFRWLSPPPVESLSLPASSVRVRVRRPDAFANQPRACAVLQLLNGLLPE
jgi:hypothetical protein